MPLAPVPASALDGGACEDGGGCEVGVAAVAAAACVVVVASDRTTGVPCREDRTLRVASVRDRDEASEAGRGEKKEPREWREALKQQAGADAAMARELDECDDVGDE